MVLENRRADCLLQPGSPHAFAANAKGPLALTANTPAHGQGETGACCCQGVQQPSVHPNCSIWVLMMLNTHTSGCCCLNCAAVLATARAAAAGAKWAAWQELCSPEPAGDVSMGLFEQALPSLEVPARPHAA